jgi:hypothetical protein
MSTVSCFAKCARRSRVAVSKVWQDCVRWFRDPYRPELHYMRGPGPKCHEKTSQHRTG